MTHSFWFLAVDALAVYRLAILVTKDTITEPVREWIKREGWREDHEGTPHERHGRWSGRCRKAFLFITCPWCVSMYLAAGVVALTRFFPSQWQYGAMLLALSGVTGFLAER